MAYPSSLRCLQEKWGRAHGRYAAAKGERCQSWVLHLPWLNFDSRVDPSLVLSVAPKSSSSKRGVVGGRTRSAMVRRMMHIDDVLHDGGLGANWVVSVGRVRGDSHSSSS